MAVPVAPEGNNDESTGSGRSGVSGIAAKGVASSADELRTSAISAAANTAGTASGKMVSSPSILLLIIRASEVRVVRNVRACKRKDADRFLRTIEFRDGAAS